MANINLRELWTDNGKTYREAKKLQEEWNASPDIYTPREQKIFEAGSRDGWQALKDHVESAMW